MKFSIQREKLQKAMQKIGVAAGSRSQIPILSNVLIEAEDGKLKLTSTDLELRMSTELEAEVSESGKTTVPAKKLSGLIGCFSADKIDFYADENDNLKFECGNGKFVLRGMQASEFPEAEDFKVLRNIKIKSSELKRMLSGVYYAVSADDSRKVLTGILISVHDGLLTMVGTDGKRMAVYEKTAEACDGEGDAVVPLKAANELKRMLEGDETVEIAFSDRGCMVKSSGFVLVSRLIEGNYPNYRQVIPTSFKDEAEISSADFLKKISTVSMVLSAESYINVKFSSGSLGLHAFSQDVGEADEIMELNYQGNDFSALYNPVFLSDPLRNVDFDTLKIKMNDSVMPMAFEGNEGFLYIIMPIRNTKA